MGQSAENMAESTKYQWGTLNRGYTDTMEEKYLWPLVGVVLGWALTFMTTGLKERAERRRRAGELLSHLISIRDQVRVHISVTANFFEHSQDLEDYERNRKGIAVRHLLEPQSQIDAIQDAIHAYSGDYPLHSLALQALVFSVLKLKAASFDASVKNPKAYASMLSMHEITVDFCEKAISKESYRVAKKHGLFTYIRLRLHDREIEKKKSGNQKYFSNFMADVLSESKRSSTPDTGEDKTDRN